MYHFIIQVNKKRDFGESWALDPEACDPSPPSTDPCDMDSDTYRTAVDLCYTMIRDTGPFRNCFDLVNPEPYHYACVYDLCATLPDDDVLCDSLAEYAQACREAGGSPEDWRAETPQCGKYQTSEH